MSEALPYVGAAIGSIWGQPQIGWAIGSVFSMALAPAQKSQGPRLEDLKVVGMAYGEPIPYIQGTHRTAGQLIWSSDRREIATTTRQGKGGPKQQNTTYTYESDCLFLVASNELSGMLRVWDNGKLVATFDDGATLGSLLASQENDSWRRITFYGGADTQLPDPTYEAAVGAGNAPAYRGMATIFIEGLQLGQSGQQPNLTFEVGTSLAAGSQQDFQDHSGNGVPVRVTTTIPGVNSWGGTVTSPSPYGASGKFNGGNIITPKYALELYEDTGATRVLPAQWRFFARVRDDGDKTIANFVAAFGNDNGNPAGLWIYRDSTPGGGRIRAYYRGNPTFTLEADRDHPMGEFFDLEVGVSGAAAVMRINGIVVARDNAFNPDGTTLGTFPSVWNVGARYGAVPAWHGYMKDVVFERGPIEPVDGFVDPGPYVPGPLTVFWIPFYYVDTVERGVETVRDVVERLCARAELPPGSYDASALGAITTPMRALAITQVGGTRATLEVLAQAYQFQMLCTDRVVFMPRAQGIVAEIPYVDLGAAEAMQASPDPFALRQRSDLEVPAQEAVTYANVIDDYQSDTQNSDRLLTGQTNTVTTTLPLALTPSEAKAIAEARVTDGAIAAWGTTLSLPPAYARLTPGDSVLVQQKDGSLFRLLLGRLTSNGTTLSFEARLEDPTVFNQPGITGQNYSPQTTVVAVAGTFLLMLDIPQLRDADNGVGLYSVARGLTPNWPGAAVFESTDMLAWESRATITESATVGSTTTTLGDWAGGNVFDETNSVEVNVGPGTLSSATRDEVLQDRTVNSILVGDEVLQYCVATATGAGTYLLTRLLRERLGTDRLTTGQPGGSRFVLLQPPGMRRVPQAVVDLMAVRYFKGVSLGRPLSTAATQPVVNRGVSVTPLAPVNARANRNSADTGITWQRRTRMQTRFLGPLSSSVPLGEAFEAYQVDVYSNGSFTTVVRTLTATGPLATYTSAQQTEDFGSPRTVLYVRIYQMSEVVGRGFPLTATI